jgi:integrase
MILDDELLDRLAPRERTLVLLAASTGLRQSELFGLKWLDVDFELKTMSVTRSIVCGFVGPCKTESSQKPAPLDPQVADTLAKWKEMCRNRKLGDWVFASARHCGRTPYWGPAILRKYIQPIAREVGTLSATPIQLGGVGQVG